MKTKMIFLVLIVLISSCSLFNDKIQPEVISIKPSSGATGIDPLTIIEITFSKEMEEPITEQAFSLKKEISTVEGSLWWSENGKILFFKPSSPLVKGAIYNCVIADSAEDKDGNDLFKEYRSSFSLNAANGKISLTSTYPICGITGVALTTNIILSFSNPVDIHSLPGGLSISPSMDVRFIPMDDGKIVVLDPLSEMINGTRYLVKLSTSIKDTNGSSLAQEYQFYFSAGTDATPPSLNSVEIPSSSSLLAVNILNSDIEKTDKLLFHFSEPMRMDSIENGISFQPPVSGRFTTTSISSILFTPDEPFLLDQVYNLNINNSVCDTSGNRLIRTTSYSFIIDGVNSRPIQVLNISNGNNPHWVQNQFVSLGMGGVATNIRIRFSSSMQPSPTISKTTVRYLFGTGSSAVQIADFQWLDNDRTLRLDLKGLDSGNTYRLTIQGTKNGVSDINENYMLFDFVIDLKT